MRAAELLRNKFGVSQLYKHEVKIDGEVVLEVFWHPLTIAERESIQKAWIPTMRQTLLLV